MNGPLDALVEAIRGARAMVGFTGAGFSTDAGIPDFRSPGSPWAREKPIPFPLFLESPLARREAWRRKFAIDDAAKGVAPAFGHRLFAQWVREGRMQAVVTQNIDGLHQAAGTAAEKVIELHGNGTYAACLECGERHELGPIRMALEGEGRVPGCVACGGLVKSATIAFGQKLRPEVVAAAETACRSADLVLIAGSSLVVHPAAALPVLAKAAGGRIALLNREPTPLDEVADFVVRGELGEILPAIAGRLGG